MMPPATFSGTIQDTGGTLALVKTGLGNLTLTGANTFSGGFTNNGSGNVIPNNNLAFGTGPVVSNAGQLYATATTIFANTLALNNSTLRIGGGNNRTITWNGPVTATGTSGLSADNGTAGITLGQHPQHRRGHLHLLCERNDPQHQRRHQRRGRKPQCDRAARSSSPASAPTPAPPPSAAREFSACSPPARSQVPPMWSSTVSGNFNIRNTVGWVYSGTITGDDTGSININSGTDAELAGPISGVSNINVNSAGTDTTVSGNISGAVGVTATGGGILTLAGNNSALSGTITLSGCHRRHPAQRQKRHRTRHWHAHDQWRHREDSTIPAGLPSRSAPTIRKRGTATSPSSAPTL